MAHAQKPDFVFRRNGPVYLNRRGRQFSRLLAAEVCASAVVMLDTPCSEVVWRVLATHSIRQFPLHFPSCKSPFSIKFQLESNTYSFSALSVFARTPLNVTLPVLFVNNCHLENMTVLDSWANISWRVESLAMGWTVCRSNPSGRRDFLRPSGQAVVPTWVSVPGIRRLERDVNNPLNLTSGVKK